MTAVFPQWLLPRGPAQFRFLRRIATPRLLHSAPRYQEIRRHASNSAKPKVLGKPTKFNPPSHAARRVVPRQYPGPPVSSRELETQKTKRYPHMMPPEGTFMHWFLTNRLIHMWIILSTLFCLAAYTFFKNFKMTSPFAHLLPSRDQFYSHPLDAISTWLTVYKMHTDHITAETAERRRKKSEDVQKRAAYRKAHGLDKEEGFGGWLAKGAVPSPAVEAVASEADGNMPAKTEGAVLPENEKGVYVDFEGKKRPVKKWLGIW